MTNFWLKQTLKLMADVDPADYIHSPDRDPHKDRIARRRDMIRSGLVGMALMALLMAAIGAGCLALGCDIIGPSRTRMLTALDRVEPNPQRWTDPQLVERYKLRVAVMDLLESAEAQAPTGNVYPYLATLTGAPPPLIEPGRGPALLLLTTALDMYPKEQRALMVDRIVSIGSAVGNEDLQAALQRLADLSPTTRQRLFGQNAAALKRIFDAEIAVEDARDKKASLEQSLSVERSVLESEHRQLSNEIFNTNQIIQNLRSSEPSCNVKMAPYLACLRTISGKTSINKTQI